MLSIDATNQSMMELRSDFNILNERLMLPELSNSDERKDTIKCNNEEAHNQRKEENLQDISVCDAVSSSEENVSHNSKKLENKKVSDVSINANSQNDRINHIGSDDKLEDELQTECFDDNSDIVKEKLNVIDERNIIKQFIDKVCSEKIAEDLQNAGHKENLESKRIRSITDNESEDTSTSNIIDFSQADHKTTRTVST